MRKRKTPHSHENHERWLISYADFITLLFAFFVVMFASSQADNAKTQKMSEAVKEAFEKGHLSANIAAILGGAPDQKGPGNAQRVGPGGSMKSAEPVASNQQLVELLPSLERLSEDLKEEIAQGKVQVSLGSRGLVISLKEAAFFASGEDKLTQESIPSIAKVAHVIGKLPNPLRFEGHTDSVPIHTNRFRSNWELSAARSIAMLDVMETRFSIPRSRMAIAGYADTAPIAENGTEPGRAKNRRVDIVVLNQSALRDEPRPDPSRTRATGP